MIKLWVSLASANDPFCGREEPNFTGLVSGWLTQPRWAVPGLSLGYGHPGARIGFRLGPLCSQFSSGEHCVRARQFWQEECKRLVGLSHAWHTMGQRAFLYGPVVNLTLTFLGSKLPCSWLHACNGGFSRWSLISNWVPADTGSHLDSNIIYGAPGV